MSEVPGDPSVASAPPAPAPEAAPAAPAAAAAPVAAQPAEPVGGDIPARETRELSIRALLESGAHFGHQTRRWDPRMKGYIFGERDGIHIVDLDQTLPLLEEALDFLKETVAGGGKVLFVGTKRQAQDPIRIEAERSEQYYVNNRWLGGMLTNFRTVRRSIDRFKEQLAQVGDEEQVADLSKKELSNLNRSITKYRKSLDGIKEMTRLPDAMFLIDVTREHIAVSEARRLGIPIVAIVDTNCNPSLIDLPIPANDDATRAIQLYCELVSDACQAGAALFNERVQSDSGDGGTDAAGRPSGSRRVVEIKPQGSGRRQRQAGGSYSAGGRRGPEAAAPDAAAGDAAKPAGEAPAPAAPADAAAPAAPADAAGATEAPAAEAPAATEAAAPAETPKE